VLCLTIYCVCISVTVNTTGLSRIKSIKIFGDWRFYATTVALNWRAIINVPVAILMILIIYGQVSFNEGITLTNTVGWRFRILRFPTRRNRDFRPVGCDAAHIPQNRDLKVEFVSGSTS